MVINQDQDPYHLIRVVTRRKDEFPYAISLLCILGYTQATKVARG